MATSKPSKATREKLNQGLKVRVERKPSPNYGPSAGKKAIRRVRETVENISQQGRNIANTVSEGARKIRKHVGR